jgi:hypothetical protein
MKRDKRQQSKSALKSFEERWPTNMIPLLCPFTHGKVQINNGTPWFNLRRAMNSAQ